MPLEEGAKYTAEGGTVHLKSAVAKDYMIFNFATEIAEILSIPTPDPLLRGEEYDIEFDKFNEEIAKEKVISGLTSDLNMPSGRRHARTGKCLGGNHGMGGNASAAFRKQYFAKRDITID